jgi:hypothetical protein
MTQTEGNHSGNRRQSQATQDRQRSGRRVLEQLEEGTGGRTRGIAELSSGTGGTTMDTSTRREAAVERMTNTEGANNETTTKTEGHSGGRQQSQATPSSQKETKELRATWPTPKESTALTAKRPVKAMTIKTKENKPTMAPKPTVSTVFISHEGNWGLNDEDASHFELFWIKFK